MENQEKSFPRQFFNAYMYMFVYLKTITLTYHLFFHLYCSNM